MIDYGQNIYQIDKNIFFAPYQQTIYEADGEEFDESKFRQWLQDYTNFHFAVQEVSEPKFSKAAEILVTDKCNLACSYCYSGGYRSTQTLDKKNAIELVNHLFRNAYLTRISSGKRDTVYILFHGGGEPTQAWDELVLIVEHANELSKKYDIKIKYNIATNGVFTKDQLAFLFKNNFDFRVSLDGIGEVNDITRLMANNKSSFPTVAGNLDDINKYGHKFNIAGVVTNENIDEMENFIKYSVEHWNNVNDLRFFMLEETELTHKNNINLLNMNKFQMCLYNGINLMIEKKIGTYKKYTSFYDYLLRNHKGCCTPSIMQMPVYNSNGDILRCNAHVFDEKAKIGKFIDNKLVFNKEKYTHLFDEIKGKTEKCNNCLCSTYCEFGGDSCVNPIKQTESYCDYMQEHFKTALNKVYNEPELISTSEVLTDPYPGIKKLVHWKI
jgi:sulfatase maturation enzyme AslB (radical SAM superfamily)